MRNSSWLVCNVRSPPANPMAERAASARPASPHESHWRSLTSTMPAASNATPLPTSGRWTQRDAVPPAQRPPLAPGGRGDGGQFFFGGGQQLTAFAGPLGGQHGLVAAHQPLAGKVRGVDLDEVLGVKQRQLQRTVVDEGVDLGGAQRADPLQLCWAYLVADTGA